MKYFKLLLIVLIFSCSSQTIPTSSQSTTTETTTPTREEVGKKQEVKEKQEVEVVKEVELVKTPSQPMSKQEMLQTVVAGKSAPVGTVYQPDNTSISTDSFKGKYVVLDFWATWCGPCVKEGPIFQEMGKRYKDKNVEFVGVSVDRDQQRWQQFLKERNWQGHQYWMGMAEMEPFFAFAYSEVELEPGQLGVIVGLPKYVMLGPDGKILHNSSFIKPSNAKFEELLNGFLE